MGKDNRVVGFGVGALTILLLSYFFIIYNPERYDWSERYETVDENDKVKKPYNVTIIHEMLQEYFPNKNFKTIDEELLNNLPIEEGAHSNYIFIGKKPFYDSTKLDRIFDYAAAGNSVFISSKFISKQFAERLRKNNCEKVFDYYNEDGELIVGDELKEVEAIEYEDEAVSGYSNNLWTGYTDFTDTVAWVNYSHNDLLNSVPIEFKYSNRYGKTNYFWDYIAENTFCEGGLDYAELSYLEPHRVNYIKIPYWRGAIYLHTTPIMFTDIQMVREEAYASAGKVFSHLEEGDIYWDNVSKINNGMGDFPGRNSDWTPLQYLLSQPSLKWAWYLLLSMVGFYLLFRAKRKQRMIPVLEQNTNTSLEFIKTVGRLYFLQNDHRKLASQKMKLFLSYVRDHYSIPTQNIDADMKQRLANKAEIPLTLVEEIFNRYQRIHRTPQVSDSHLANFHFAVEEFYKKSK